MTPITLAGPFKHPVPEHDLRMNPRLAKKVINELFVLQCAETAAYLALIAQDGHWGDDDTDYLPANCHLLMHLQDLAYDAPSEDICAFLYDSAVLADADWGDKNITLQWVLHASAADHYPDALKAYDQTPQL